MSAATEIPLSRQILWSVIAFILAWFCLELGYAAYSWLRPQKDASHLQYMYQAHPYRAYAPVPGRTDTDGKRSFNSFGLRGPEIAREKPPDTVRIICIGASTTFSDGAATDSRSYPAQMGQMLNEHFGDAPFRVESLNAGVQGCTSIESVIYLQTRLLDLSPDVAILHNGVNETWGMLEMPGFKSDYTHVRHTFCLPGRKWWEWSPCLSYHFARHSITNPWFPKDNANLNVMIMTRPAMLWDNSLWMGGTLEPQMMAAYERNLRTFVALCRGNGIIPVLSTQIFGHTHPKWNRWIDAVAQCNQTNRRLARELEVDLVDLAAQMSWNPQDFYDFCHVLDTPTGLVRKSRIFADALIAARVVERAHERQSGSQTEP